MGLSLTSSKDGKQSTFIIHLQTRQSHSPKIRPRFPWPAAKLHYRPRIFETHRSAQAYFQDHGRIHIDASTGHSQFDTSRFMKTMITKAALMPRPRIRPSSATLPARGPKKSVSFAVSNGRLDTFPLEFP